jgi:hypothetical protein
MDVHAETIAVAIAEGRANPRSLGTIPNRPEAVRKLIAKLGDPSSLRVCYEAGPTGYVLYWQLTRLGIHCDVIAPSLVPKMAGDRIKTDRRDAEKLARSYRAGDLSPLWVPDAAHESLRDLVRAREAAKEDELRARHRLSKYLLRYGQRPCKECRAWTAAWWQWLRGLQMPHAEQNIVYPEHDAGFARGRRCRPDCTWTSPGIHGQFKDLALSESCAIIRQWRLAAANNWPSWRMNSRT